MAPAEQALRCAYVARQVAVKAGYGLWVTQAEHDAIVRVLGACPDEPSPVAADGEPPAQASPPAVADPAADAAPDTDGVAPGEGDVVYENCAAVRAAGAAPIRSGEPGYSRQLDGDGDGVGCE